MQNKKGNLFVFMALILYVYLATSAYKTLTAYLMGLKLTPMAYLAFSLGFLALLGAGLVVANKLVQAWLAKKMD